MISRARTFASLYCIFALACVVVACTTTRPQGDVLGRWLLTDMSGSAVLEQTQPTLVLAAPDRAHGSAGCNGFGAVYRVEGDRLIVEELETTIMACGAAGERRQAIADQERRFLSALRSSPTILLPGSELVLDAGNGVVLRFQRAG